MSLYRKPPFDARQVAGLSLLLYGHSQKEVASLLGVSPACVCVWRRRFEEAGLIGPDLAPRGRPRAAVESVSGADVNSEQSVDLSPEVRDWLERGWGESCDREWEQMELGLDWWSRTHPRRPRGRPRLRRSEVVQ